ncbi:DUF7260 family protein [Haloplanus aerogenes]|uniref:DUF7260 domain-containing protein n=1 Tax=Haloplanus aerogenes TaxID=660522 RepID=A0A3M0DWL5_9EURY|nr:hypothetical protein [Haloplanus aerogenes]AZH25605.1 hypothetical protein DU502_09515 [Haloplanus aerogenes]RMB25327.1 hypothetical protein ATH50_0413 [Haloplanus aerogenes]
MTARIDDALGAVAEERVSVQAEYDALETFDRRVAELSTVTVSPGSPLVADPQPSGQSLERARTAYAETMMSVPHYEAEYGDTVAESLAAEFGDDLAAALLGGTALTPELRDAVRAAATAARHEREEFLDVLDREADSLATAEDDVATLRADLDALDDRPLSGRSFDDLHDLWSTFREFQSRVDGIALHRQETIRGHRSDLPGVPTDLCEYLYADLSVSYPVLATLADLGDDLERARGRVARALASTA